MRLNALNKFHEPLVSSGGFQKTQLSPLNEIVVKEFHEFQNKAPEYAMAVAVIRALTCAIKDSKAQTFMGVSKDLEEAATALQRMNPCSIALKAACEIFLRYATRTMEKFEQEKFDNIKAELVERGIRFEEASIKSREKIVDLASRFVRPNAVVLVHGYSRVVLGILERVASMGCLFSVIVAEARPDDEGSGLKMVSALDRLNVPVTLVPDAGVAYVMEEVDIFLAGAEAVVENGGVVGRLGTYQVALCARACSKPVYVAAESYTFARLFPVSQRDLPNANKPMGLGPLLPQRVKVAHPSRDYTPPTCIDLLVTDLGVLTPAAVSDELIQLYL
uniref:Translation initiation factor eIF2B subunit alpha n=1 Tax=Polytomella parva TaxID=51329 RepID=A0A7S0YAX7_9CHLO|mmetsp:Transcript_19159/g.34666  ORF Transcript_19159/g.34666 Transcript_19159/m.34666 type:complete len:333 (+) Transcript_19159:70-1068(+)|eukprot:CAMPEP_0175054664 /NCGR_PEP_ID=MMETSP0052_2-20121109/9629_1 /TAXON_ID=51329 ORGANISM="Polytomella parva, Strain SAG 63-3" /NCGR_SAMPLE_ID=MMETSP0052_2 /ASSEMBLY_ACC=CAM_ASM_000194 /LENGTH=332 /DNA_ID=CAMNT_0016319381 /DNA_START=43 /DNA_END=1041 /DNA_ORIENTATION=-